MVEVAEEALVARLWEYLDRANHGKIVVVTRDGTPLVQLVPVHEAETIIDDEKARNAVDRIRARSTRWGIYASPSVWRSWVNEGHE